MFRFLVLLPFLFWASFSGAQPMNATDAAGKKQGYWEKRDTNGKLVYQATFKDDRPVGEMKRFHPNGKLKAVLNYPENSDEATAVLFDESGHKIAEGKYLGQKKSGEWSYYSEEKLIATDVFENDVKNGLSKKYYKSGEILEECPWENGLQQGVYRAYFKNGKPYLECKYENGRLSGYTVSYFENGNPESESFYQNGLLQGESRFFDESGNILYVLKYDQGKLLNPEVLDSVMQSRNLDFEPIKKIPDPEKYMQDPSEYLRQLNQGQ